MTFSKTYSLCALAALLCLLASSLALADADIKPELSFAKEADGIVCALRAELPQGYHAYAHAPGETGRPTVLGFHLADGSPATVLYPRGTLQRDFYDTDATISVYEEAVELFVKLPAGACGQGYRAALSLLMCSQSACQPVDKVLEGQVPAEPEALARTSWGAGYRRGLASFEAEASGGPMPAEAPGAMPFALAGPSAGASSAGQGFKPVQLPAEASGGEAQDPAGAGLPRSPRPSAAEDAPQPPPSDISIELSPVNADEALEISGLGKALLLGLIAGLILNVMPCVLPVVTFKLSALLLGRRNAEGVAEFRRHNIFFALGILVQFTLLAVVLGALDLIWGQIYQSQEFILVMIILIFLMALSMFGIFNLPMVSMGNLSKAKSTRLDAFVGGFLSTILATPCSGPLLGGVLGWAFTQSLPVLIVVFWSVGLGMALPYIVFSIFPKLVHVIPRPGSWMEVFERIVGFLLFATCIYLLSILPDWQHLRVLAVLLPLGAAAYLWGRHFSLHASTARRRVGGLLFACAIAASVFFVLSPREEDAQWQAFHPQDFVAGLGTKPMLVEFTADWCPNCKFVEATVFTEDRMRGLKEKYGIEFVRVDITDANAYGLKLLGLLGSRSIPLTALFPAGPGAKRPVVLRDVFSADALKDAAGRAFDR
ncbi:MAG: thioredoxin family protein [Desulfovibrio sp.]|nr:thioredoxin family protein [Desulfovibrio sp.]